MRIQHNILAMNAYRNYNTNTSALAKNLEKLSSGYKINRAGDDAAGLAISEKMRAQITGLNAAQKNVKDGISLVKTAEGAMQEIQDMLNRMDYLATQSANGTYDDPVDRLNLQKEVDQLKSEINRIADSANFNGIKLLDGSLSKDGVASIESKFNLPDVGTILGKDTVLHRDEDESAASTAFGLELHNVKFSGKKDDSFTIEIGGTKLTGTLQKDMKGDSLENTLTGADMAASLLGDTSKVKFTNEAGATIDPNNVTIAGKEYSMVKGETDPSTGEGTGVLFKLNNPESDVNVSMDVKIYANAAEGATSTAKMISGTASTSAVSPALGNITTKGTASGKATTTVITSSGAVNASKIGLVRKNTITNTGAVTSKPLVSVITGKADKITEDKTNAKYEISFDAKTIQEVIDAGTTTNWTGGPLTFVENTTTAGTFDLMAGTDVIGSVTSTAMATAAAGSGIAEIKNAASGKVIGQIKITSKTAGGAALTAANINTDLASYSKSDVGLNLATIKLANPTALDNNKLTAAAVAAGATDGDIKMDFDADANQVQLKIGSKVIGYADASQVNAGTLTFYDATSNKSIGSMTLAGNTKLNSSHLASFFKDSGAVDTGLDYADAKVKASVSGAVNHDKMAAAAKKAFKAEGKEITGNEKLSISYNGTDFDLKLGDVKIGTGAMATGAITFKDLEGTPNTLFTISTPGATTTADLAIDNSALFEDIGPVITPEEKTVSTVDTTALGSTDAAAKKLAKAVTKAAEKAGVELNGKVDLTISYNEADEQFELKAGDVVVGKAAAAGWVTGTGAAGTAALATSGTLKKLTLTFSDDDGGALGNVTIDELANDFDPKDLVGSISTKLTYDPKATPPITADFSGLDTSKLKEFAEDAGDDVADGAKLEVVNNGGGSWTLQFNDGTNTVTVETGNLSFDGKSIDFGDYGKVNLSGKYDAAAIQDAGAEELTTAINTGLALKEKAIQNGISGDYQKTTTDQMNSQQGGGDRLASTVLTLTNSMIQDGASIFVAGKNYTFSTNANTVMPEGAVKVDVSDLDAAKLGDNYMSAVVKRLTDAYAADNTGVYTLGWNGKNVTVTETLTHGNLKSDGSNDDTYPVGDKWDLRTMEGIAKSLGYSSASTKGNSLTLQIGDTSDAFNQMQVSIGDMHTTAMGAANGASIADIDISSLEGAQAAVQTIKDAINYVSGVRGDLGATQNRLEHTANNLSVMAENIQDAESTIRDTDIAEEMMAYTKNNILIQSAQAMLAQANAVPQGVLQLLG